MLATIQGLLGEFRVSVNATTLSRMMEGTKMVAKHLCQWEKMCPPGLGERKLDLDVHPYLVAGSGSTVGCEEVDWGGICQT